MKGFSLTLFTVECFQFSSGRMWLKLDDVWRT